MTAAALFRRLHEAATPGDWSVAPTAHDRQVVVTAPGEPLPRVVAWYLDPDDAVLIATLRSLLPELLVLSEVVGAVGDHRSDAWHMRRIRFARDALDARAAELAEEDDRE